MDASKPAGKTTRHVERLARSNLDRTLRGQLSSCTGLLLLTSACTCTDQTAAPSPEPASADAAPTQWTGYAPAATQQTADVSRSLPTKSPLEAAHAPLRPAGAPPLDPTLRSRPIQEQQSYLLALLEHQEQLTPDALDQVRRVVRGSDWLGFGNPKVARPVMRQEECLHAWEKQSPAAADPECRHPNMVHVPNSNVCIDQFEFPNVLCEYPVVWVRSSEAQMLCEALGKRLCDAHEWEGACAGDIGSAESEYSYPKLPRGAGPEYRRARRMLMESWHNMARAPTWAYGPVKSHALCGTGAKKSPSCTTVDFGTCGTNDYPAGSFPDCRTKSGIYDQHGNAAEHMSLPLFPEELGGKGYTEMKGSWFLFQRDETHPDDCRWRARNWHTTKIDDPNSHRNYHLGFRCCADLPGSSAE